MDEDYGVQHRSRKPYKPPMGCMTKALIWLIVIAIVLAGAVFAFFKYLQKDNPELTLKEFLTFAWKGTQETVNDYKDSAKEKFANFEKWVEDRLKKSKKTQAWLDKTFPGEKPAGAGKSTPKKTPFAGRARYKPGTSERIRTGEKDPDIEKLREKYSSKAGTQPKPPSDDKITLLLNNKPLGEVLEEISRKSNVILVPEPAAEEMRVSVEVKDAQWKDALEQICSYNDLAYEKVEEHLYYITIREPEPPVVAKADPDPEPVTKPDWNREVHPDFQAAADKFRRGLVLLQKRKFKEAYNSFDDAQDHIEKYKQVNPDDPRIEKFEEELALYKHSAMKDSGWGG